MERDTVIATLLLAALILPGCASGAKPKAVAREISVPPRYTKDVKPVDNLDRTALFLAHLNLKGRYQILNLSNKLYLDDDADRATEVFGPPPKAYDVTELPPGWKEQGFKAAGWETSTEGFGMVLQKDRIALAMFSVEHADEGLFDRLVSDYDDELGRRSVTISDKRAKYRFWTADDQTLMVSSCITPRQGVVVTVALGARQLMEALRMNPDRAKEDLRDAAQLASQRLKTPASK